MPVDLMNELLSRRTNFSVVDYLSWIRQVLGESVYQQLLQLSPNVLNFEKVFTLQEQYLYGSKRLGVRRPKLLLATAPHTGSGYQTPIEVPAPGGGYNHDCNCYVRELPSGAPPSTPSFATRFYIHELGKKEYELSNHLGNVLATVLDRKTGVKASATATTYAWFKADVASAQDYYPFGSLLPGRTYTAAAGEGYRFGFNGMQRDDEVKGPGNSLDFGARMYDSRLGRWMSVDPLALEYVDLSPYIFVANNPIYFVDVDGKRIIVPDKAHQKVISGYLNDQFGADIFKYNKSGQLKLDKKAYKAAKGNFNQNQIDIVKGVLEVIKSDRERLILYIDLIVNTYKLK
jgi:RHS repeat-associated protein